VGSNSLLVSRTSGLPDNIGASHAPELAGGAFEVLSNRLRKHSYTDPRKRANLPLPMHTLALVKVTTKKLCIGDR
jgi:hypothetical protein